MTLKFLKHIWPSQGFYCVAVPKKTSSGHSYYDQKTFTNIKDAAKAAEVIDEEGKDCYMAVGSLKARKIYDPVEEKHKIRTQDNMGWYRTLILDIDCGVGKPYATQAEAAVELKKFCEETYLPKPTLVNSGYGWHVYYTLSRDVDAEEWHELSLQLKAVAKHLGLDVDNSRTSDKSSVLRVAGTHNHKREKIAPVVVVKWGDPSRPELIAGRLITFITDNNIEVTTETSFGPNEAIKQAFAGFSDNIYASIEESKKYTKFLEPDLTIIAKKCSFVARGLETRGAEASYDEWRALLSYSSRTNPTMNVEVSDGHEGYTENDMLSMVASLAKSGPFKCETVRTHSPKLCEGCTENVRNPLMLDRRLRDLPVRHPDAINAEIDAEQGVSKKTPSSDDEDTTADFGGINPELTEEDFSADFGGVNPDLEEVEEVEKPDEKDDAPDIETRYGFDIAPPPAPYPWKIEEDGIYSQVEDGEGGFLPPEKICEYLIYPYGLTAEADGDVEHIVKITIKLPHEKKYKTFEMPLSAYADIKLCTKIWADAGLVPAGQDKTMELFNFMKAYTKIIQSMVKTVRKNSQLGWSEDGQSFVLPEFTLHADGTKEVSDVSKSISPAVRPFGKAGTMEEWRSVIDTYNRPGWEKFAFGHLVGYGSLLFRFTDYDGAIVNFVGKPGTGKSGILHSINTMFGHYKDMLVIHEDTQLAKMSRFGIFNSICATYDEITNIEGDELSSLCYAISQGRGRHRLTQNADLKENNTTWEMIMAATSNLSLIDKLSALKNDGSAEALRVFEYRVDGMNELGKQEAQDIFDKLKTNYGHSGEPFITYVIQHQEEVKKLVRHYREKFDDAADVPINERFWSAIVSTVLAGGHIANKLNLAAVNLDNLFLWAVREVKRMRTIVAENDRQPQELLSEFLAENYGYTLTVIENEYDGKITYRQGSEARGKLYVREEVTTGKTYITKTVIHRWLQEGGSNYHVTKTALRDMGILLNETAKKTLSLGSDGPSTGQTKCWLINMNHPAMRDSSRPVNVSSEADNILQMENKKQETS